MEKKKKYILIGLGVVAIGTGAYIMFMRSKKNSTAKTAFTESFASASLPELPAPQSSSSSSRPRNRNKFPLKRGSSGSLVTQLQQALISKYGKSILPRYGADGGFGSETVKALQSKGLPTEISSEAFEKITSGSSSSSSTGKKKPSSSKLALYIYKAILGNDFIKSMAGLRLIKSVSQYIQVNGHFKEKRIGMVRRTLVTAMLQTFTTSTQKKFINQELHRIGLKFNGSQWSLSGFESSNQLVTIKSTKIWDSSGSGMMIPKGTIVGVYQEANQGVTTVETIDGKTLFINTNAISYIS